MSGIPETDLILNGDGSVYHLNLLPEDVAGTVITVGDPDRVQEVSKYFDRVELRKSKREFVAHTGCIGQKRLTVISTGIGTDNIDIVLNELDALVNIDLENRTRKPVLTSLDIIRIGTSGAIQADIALDSILVSEMAIGLDTLMHYYKQENNTEEKLLLAAFKAVLPASHPFSPYIASGSADLIGQLAKDVPKGITISSPGFYAPQGRQLRLQLQTPGLINAVQTFRSGESRITNLEMETAGIYGLASLLGHRAISFNVILANRITGKFSKQPQKAIEQAIELVLGNLIDS
ncbi:MAG: nucleoside phosphorylase [Bacteroidetes bacterium]|nr:nucleoside phosphorylase [Bacteroidota bacterium]